MHRMLTIFVVLLTAAIGGLGLYVLRLSDRVAENASGRARSAVPVAPTDEPLRAEMKRLEERLAAADDRIRQLRRDLEFAAMRERETAREAGSDAATPPPPSREIEGAPPRDASGAYLFTFTEEEIERAAALQREVERRRRVEGMVRAAMRRVDGLVAKGEIGPLFEERRAQVQEIIQRYLAEADALVQKHIRNPDPGAELVTGERRRELLTGERERMGLALRQDLLPILGQRDAEQVAESVLTSSYLPRNPAGRGGRGAPLR
jgi:hypothetical protein